MTSLFLCLCFNARADITKEDISPAEARKLGWKIDVHEEAESVRFTVAPPASGLTDYSEALLSVVYEGNSIVFCTLGPEKMQKSPVYSFTVSKDFLKGSQFRLDSVMSGPLGGGASYTLKLDQFANSPKTNVEQSPGGDSLKAAPQE